MTVHGARPPAEPATAGTAQPGGTRVGARAVLAAPSLRLLVFTLVLLGSVLWSLSEGADHVSLGSVWQALLRHDLTSVNGIIINEVRLPRVIAAALVGAGFAVAGAILQGMTRNGLASPELMGLTSGAQLTLVVAFVFLMSLGNVEVLALTCAGAAVGAFLVYGIAALSPGGLAPVRLALAGIVVSTLLAAITSGLTILYQQGQSVLLFFAGGVSGVTWGEVRFTAPFVAAGLVGAQLLARDITVLSLGDEVAKGLGQRTARTKVLASLVVILLAGAAVWVGGPVGFIGLITPHIARFIVGLDYRWIIPMSAVVGAWIFTVADLVARTIAAPTEEPVGVITALVGVPFFIYLARRDQRGLLQPRPRQPLTEPRSRGHDTGRGPTRCPSTTLRSAIRAGGHCSPKPSQPPTSSREPSARKGRASGSTRTGS